MEQNLWNYEHNKQVNPEPRGCFTVTVLTIALITIYSGIRLFFIGY